VFLSVRKDNPVADLALFEFFNGFVHLAEFECLNRGQYVVLAAKSSMVAMAGGLPIGWK